MRRTMKIVLLLAVFMLPVFLNAEASAATRISDAKAALEGLYSCYKGSGMRNNLKPNEFVYSNSSYSKNLSLISNSGLSKTLPLPTGHFEKNTANCRDIMIGAQSSASNAFPGLNSMFSFSIPSATIPNIANGKIARFYTDMGYERNDVEVEKSEITMCFNLPYSDVFVGGWPTGTIVLDEAIYTHYACIEVDRETHIIAEGKEWHVTNGNLQDTFDSVYWTPVSNSDDQYARLKITVVNAFLGGWDCWGWCSESFMYKADFGSGISYTIENFADAFYSKAVEMGAASYSYVSYYYPGEPQYYIPPIDEKEIITQYDLMETVTDSAEYAMNSITNGVYKDYDSLEFTPDEVFDLYVGYLRDYYNSGSITLYCGASSNTDFAYYDGKVAAGELIKFSIKTPDVPDGQTCYATAPSRNKGDKVYGVNSRTRHFDGTQLSLDAMLEALDGMEIEDEIPDEFMTSPGTTDGGGILGGTTENEDPCYSAGIEGMSWILCPAMNNMKYTANALDNTIQSWLEVDTQWYDRNSATHTVWGYMRNFANAIMIIVFLAIIFSQLTGHGIDNYGIKKMLPRLIMMAVLINLSFVVCELAVDLANILGSGLRDMFGAIGQRLLDSAGFGAQAEDFIAKVLAIIMVLIAAVSAGAVIGTEAHTAYASGSNVMMVVIIVLALIVIIAAILLFFLALATRLVIVIGCIASAPVAMACFILPNTQFVFKKWMNAFKIALLMYPICGALGGIGILIRGMVAPTEGTHFFMLIVGLVVPYLPFFLIPSMIKGALAGLGQVGGALTNMGMAWKGGFRSSRDAMRNAEIYRATMERGRRNINFNRAGFQYDRNTGQILLDENGQPKMRKMNRFQRFMAGGDVGMARARSQALRDLELQNREYALMHGGLNPEVSRIREDAAAREVESARLNMRGETGNYNTDIMGTQLNELLTRLNANGSLTDTEKNKVRALSAQLASQSGGAKKIYEAMKDKGGLAAQLMGEYMANNSKVRQALESKSQRTASRITDIASGAIDSNMTQEAYDRMNNQYLAYQRQQVALGQQAVSEAEWRASEAAAGRTVDETTVVQNIARNVLDKDKDFVTQSGAEVSELVRHISPERINRMAANATLFGYGDVAEGVQNTIMGMASRNGGGTGGGGGGSADYDDYGDFGGAGADIPRGDGGAGMDTDSILDWNTRDNGGNS